MVSVTAGGPVSPRGHIFNQFYGRVRLIPSVLRASKLSVMKLIEIVSFGVNCTIPFGFNFFLHFDDITLHNLKYNCQNF